MEQSPPSSMRLETVVSWAPDPRGWGLFAGLVNRLRRDLARGVVIDTRSSTFGGWANTPQRFTGLAGLAAGRQRALVSSSSQLVNERSTGNETAMRAFYEQLSRKQGT